MGVIYKNGVAYGGGGGVGGDYSQLDNLPKVNDVTLLGNLDSEEDLGIDKIDPLTNAQMSTLLAVLN